MNIKLFKEDNIITRNEPCIYEHNKTKDSSWCGDRLILKGHDSISKIIFLKQTDPPFENEILQLSYARDPWDEGWCPYPEHIWQKVANIIQNKLKKCPECGRADCRDPLHWD